MHVIQRGNKRQAWFFAEDDYLLYLDWLKEYAGKTGCRIHAYVLMTNQVHLFVLAEAADRGRCFDEGPGATLRAF